MKSHWGSMTFQGLQCMSMTQSLTGLKTLKEKAFS